MKKLSLIASLIFIVTVAFGGGIVTNSNQSAYWVRTLVRDAAIGPDAVYFNPAGLTILPDGFYFSLSSQTIFQTKDVTNNYPNLMPTPKKYHGEVTAPVFPSLYGTWKKNRVAVSFGFNPIGGGGGATYKDGLPSFEHSISDMVPIINNYGAIVNYNVTDYRREVYFKGTSVFFGYQLGITYQITDAISVYAGARYVTAKNTYNGYLRNVEVNRGGNWIGVSDAFSNLSSAYTSLALQATMGAGYANMFSSTMQTMINAGLPSTFTLAQAQNMEAISAEQRAQIEGGLTALGIDAGLQLGQIQAACNTLAPILTGQSQALTDGAQAFTETAETTRTLFNQEADAKQTGYGITPIIGINIEVNDKLNFGLKYEFLTRIELKNKTKSDFIVDVVEGVPVTMFPDGDITRSDMPAMLSAGVNYRFTDKFSATAGFHYYWDKAANYGKTLNGEKVENKEVIDNNYFELGLGIEYGFTEKLFGSIGYLYAKPGVSDNYQSDMNFSLPSNTIGGGFGYKLGSNFMINVGALYSVYDEGTKIYGVSDMYSDTFYKNNLILSLGLDFSF